MAKRSVQDIYKGSFKDRPRFDAGGYVDYASATPNAQYLTTDGSGGVVPDNNYTPGNSGAPSSSDISGLTNGATMGGNSVAAQAGDPAMGLSPPPGAGGNALTGALGWLGGKQGSSVLSALSAILTATGQMQQAKAYSKLPTMPGLPGMPGAGTASTGSYGPPGGYNYKNYAGNNGSTPGFGYAPRTQAATKPGQSYYTYGQGPEQQFFQQVQPTGGPITPVPHKRGGRVKKFAIGGIAGALGAPEMASMSGAPWSAQPQLAASQVPQSPVAQQTPASSPYPAPTNSPAGTAPLGARTPTLVPPSPAPQSFSPPSMSHAGQGMAANGTMMGQNHNFTPNGPFGGRLQVGPAPRRGIQTPMIGRSSFAHGGQNQGALSQPPQGSRYVRGPGDGTSDDIPARLANGEYVLSADVVSGLGNGDNNSGAKVLDGFVKNLRVHKAGNASKGKLPADAKPIHKYMGGQ